MAEIDRRTIEDYGLDGQVLMEVAGRKVADWLSAHLPPGSRVLFLCGPGNNGGDGLVAARAWADVGGIGEIFLLAESQGDAARNWRRAWAWNLKFLTDFPANFDGYAQVVDALFGTGLSRSLEESLLEKLRALPPERTLAVDIPSGVHSQTGQILGGAVRAHTTLTFGLPKLGQLLQPGASYCGHLRVETIGFPRALLESEEWPGQWVSEEWVKGLLPRLDFQSHKRNSGKVLVVAGSSRYPGAAWLAAQACLRSGAGLVYVYAPECVLSRLPVEAIPLSGGRDGYLGPNDLGPILESLGQVDSLCLGPGLGLHPSTLELVRKLLQQNPLPAVVDADALQSLPEKLAPRVLLTPHHGELSRLLRVKVVEVEKDRLSMALRAARNTQASVLLKGDPTLVVTPGGSYFVSQAGTPVLAQGGSGDVLSGVAATLLAQGLSASEAGACAAYLQGMAGRASGLEVGLGASRLCDELARVRSRLATA